MPETENHPNTILEVTVNPAMSVYWTRERCWHGEKVKIAVRSMFIPDNAVVELTISPKDGDAFVLVKDQKITSSKLDYEYTIDWKEKPPPAGKVEFLATASTTKTPLVTATTKVSLFVDLTPPVFFLLTYVEGYAS